MAQQRLRDFQSPLGSFLHNLVNLGVHRPGRFCGFDTILQTGQLQFSLTHVASGINTADGAGNPYGPLGVMMSNQGEMLLEDAPINGLTIDTNAGNNLQRIDLIVLNHQYIQLANPAQAVYTVVKGPLNASIPPALNAFQTLVGTLVISPQASLITQAVYTKAICPDSGDSPDAKLSTPNDFSAINQNNQEPNSIALPVNPVDSTTLQLWDVPPTGNTFIIAPQAITYMDTIRVVGGSNRNGTEINLVLNQFIQIRNNVALDPVSIQSGYAPILFSSRFTASQEFFQGKLTNVLRPSAGATTQWVATLVRVGGAWIIKSVDGVNFNTSNFLKGMTMEITASLIDMPNSFNPTGLGINDWTGWAFKNSNNNTGVDRRGIMPIGAIDISSAGAPAVDPRVNPLPGFGNLNTGSTGGRNSHQLLTLEMPKLNLGVPGITGGDNNDNNNEGQFAGGDKPFGQGVAFNIQVNNGGNDQPHNNLPAFEATIWVVRIV